MYKIQLPNFEGPFDLLLYFIKRDELNIYDIPIAKITDEFLQYIRLIRIFDLELAGDFILMASNLMYIKSQLLLPIETIEGEDENQEDPRKQLVQRLLEYKQIKEAAISLRNHEEENKYNYYRNLFEADRKQFNESENFKNATLFDLLNAFQKVFKKNIVETNEHIVSIAPLTVEEQSEIIVNILNEKNRIFFFEFISNQSKEMIVLTFLALLDLVKYRKILIFQDEHFDDISIVKRNLEEEEIEILEEIVE